MVAPINKDYDIGRVDSNVPINIVEEQIYVSLTLNFYTYLQILPNIQIFPNPQHSFPNIQVFFLSTFQIFSNPFPNILIVFQVYNFFQICYFPNFQFPIVNCQIFNFQFANHN